MYKAWVVRAFSGIVGACVRSYRGVLFEGSLMFCLFRSITYVIAIFGIVDRYSLVGARLYGQLLLVLAVSREVYV